MLDEQRIRDELAELEGKAPVITQSDEYSVLARKVEVLFGRVADMEIQISSLRGRIQDLEHRVV